MAGVKITEIAQTDAVKAAASFIVTQQETVNGTDVESLRRAGMGAAANALRDSGLASRETVGYEIFKNAARRMGNLATSGLWNNINSKYEHVLTAVSGGDKIVFTTSDDNATTYAFLTADTAPVNGAAAPLCSGTTPVQVAKGRTFELTAPDDAQYFYIKTVHNDTNVAPKALTRCGIDLMGDVLSELISQKAGAVSLADDIAGATQRTAAVEDRATALEGRATAVEGRVSALEAPAKIKWCAMGDSITQGYYSAVVDGQVVSHTDRTTTWAYRLARAKGWDFTNLAVGGTGYIDPVNQPQAPDYKEYRGWQVATETDFSEYDLITVALGINDYKGRVPLGSFDGAHDLTAPSTIYDGIMATIAGIKATAKATAKIILFTPLNARGTGDTLGTYAGDYSIGYAIPSTGATLNSVREAIIKCAEYYEVDWIDQTYSGVVNSLTLKGGMYSSAPDGVHPSLEAHAELALEYAEKIKFDGATWDITRVLPAGTIAREIWRVDNK